jgi:hypothetical protein
MGKNSRERNKAKKKADEAARRRRAASSSTADDPPGLFGAPRIPPQRRLAEQILDQTVYAQHTGDTAEVARCRELLTTGPGGAEGVQLVNRVLLDGLQRDVDHAWRRGWQPAELVRAVRRERSTRHGRLITDVIAARMRAYPAATVDRRWAAQLSALDAQVWWEHDDHYVTAFGDLHGLDRAATIAVMTDTRYVLAMLPTIEMAGPVPGDARSATAAIPADLDLRMLDRVRALLAKAESTEFPEEAEAFTAKAQELMARHRIDHALLVATTGEREQPATRRVMIDNPYEAPKTLLLQVVAEANGCRAVWEKSFGFTTVVGFPTDLDATELLFTSLLVQATRTMMQTTPRAARDGRNTTRSFRQSFLTAYASRIGERLAKASVEVDREMTESVGSAHLLPVLVARDDAVRDAFEAQFPDLTQRATPINNREGWASGRAAADRASLHGRTPVAGA